MFEGVIFLAGEQADIKKSARSERGRQIRNYILQWLELFIGAVIASIGLELFLIPNQVIDGGVVGLSIMGHYMMNNIPFGIFLVVLNIPFLYIGYKHIGKNFAISTVIAVIMLSLCSEYAAEFDKVTNDPFLAAIFGGIIDGIGVGIIMRAGGSLDGTEIVAIIADKHSPFSVGEVVMFINLFILSGAGLLFGWDKAMYSLVAYFVIAKMIDVVTKGFDETYAVMIVTKDPIEVTDELNRQLGRGVTILHGQGGYTKLPKEILYCVVNRLEVTKVKEIVLSMDENAFVTINSVYDIVGGRFKTKGH
ncbi:MAG: YitT family protein [Selenomonadaceae bacterium]|nr:YitT family protein [Selenomonadaceae bacterium]